MNIDTTAVIVTAIMAGIANGLSSTINLSINDAYSALKTVLKNRYEVGLDNLENKPKSEVQLQAVAESIKDKNAGQDKELFEIAKKLLELAKNETSKSNPAVSIKELEATYMKFAEINGKVEIGKAKIKNGVEFGKIDFTGNSDPKE